MIETSNEVPPMSVVMTFFSPIALPRNIDAVTPDTGPESRVSSGASPARRSAGGRHRHGPAAALRDLQAVLVAQVHEARIDFLQVVAHHRAEIGVQGGFSDSLGIAPFGSDVHGAGDENIARNAFHQVPDAKLVGRVAERPQ